MVIELQLEQIIMIGAREIRMIMEGMLGFLNIVVQVGLSLDLILMAMQQGMNLDNQLH